METHESIPCDTCVKQTRFSPDYSHVSIVRSGSSFILRQHLNASNSISINTGGDIYDHDFYPGFSSHDPLTQCVLIASRNRPVHLYNTAESGRSVSAYTAYSLTEEIIHPICLKFSPLCKNIIGGFSSSTVKVWDVQRPGRQISDLIYSTRKSRGSVKGIVSAVEFATEDTFFSGTYTKAIALFDMRDKAHCMHIGSDTPEFGGVVQLKFLPETHSLLSGHRTDSAVLGFDIRKPDAPVLELPRVVKTHQRFEFDILSSKSQLFAGDHYGDLTVFDLKKDGEIILNKSISACPLVSVSVSPEGYLVTGSGVRSFPDMLDSDDDNLKGPEPISSIVGFHRIALAPS